MIRRENVCLDKRLTIPVSSPIVNSLTTWLMSNIVEIPTFYHFENNQYMSYRVEKFFYKLFF